LAGHIAVRLGSPPWIKAAMTWFGGKGGPTRWRPERSRGRRGSGNLRRPPAFAGPHTGVFAIVLLPIPTAVISAFSSSAGTVLFYGATLALSSGALTALAWTAYRHPELSEGRTPLPRERVLGNLSTFLTQVIATTVGCVFADAINYWAFFLMFLTGPIEHLIRSRWRSPE
jgi:hypothetical protein